MRGVLLLLAISAAAASAQDSKPAPPMPRVRPRPTIEKPVDLLKCKPASSKEEAKAREAAESENFSDHEVLSRLIFSQTLATGYFAKRCNAPNLETLMEGIGWVVMNRVDKYSPKRDDPKPDALFHVAFAPKQFAPSFSSKDNNPFAKAFLCPLEAQKYLEEVKTTDEVYAVYSQAREVAARVLDRYQRKGIEVQFSRISNFFYPYSDFGGDKRPSWAKDPDPAKNKGFVKIIDAEKPCAEFYRR